ncbi:MAG: CHAT domain-containing protein [Nitrospirota bacterium]|nr:CHAT domain-containing protein [Nitrospirota bacterium]
MEEEKHDIGKLLEERVRLDSLLHSKFTKKIAIMFTDIKGSTTFYDTRGDIDGRVMVHRHNEIVLPIIEANKGVLLKTIGDATMSVYDDPIDAVSAAIKIQMSLFEYNRGKQAKEQIHVRAGLNYGEGIVEQNDVYGDIVNVASRVESLADAGEIIVTDDLYRAVRSHDEFIFRFIETVEVKGKKDPISVYRVLWLSEEACLGKLRKAVDIPQEKEGIFVIEASLSGEMLKVSGVEKSEGEERAAKSYDELKYNNLKIKEYNEGITELLNRANRRGKIGSDLLGKLKEYGGLLFDELIPVQIKEQLAGTVYHHLLFSLDDKLVHIPWELLFDGRDFLCQRFSAGRTVSTKQRVSGVVRAVGRPLKMQVLADPRSDLSASYEEGVGIKNEMDMFEDQVDISLKTTDISADYVKAKIRNFDIVHYAGHAVHDTADPQESGWMLNNGKLKAGEIISMTGMMPMPALVFSNACQTGQTGEWQLGEDFENRIFGLANAFLLSGVQHYVGTFWEIPDQAGSHFAVNFYRNLVRGSSIGDAIRLARQALIEKFGEDTIIWAGYMLYGDPTARYIFHEAAAKKSEPRKNEEEKEVLVSADLRHGTERVQISSKKKTPSMAVIAGIIVVIALGLGFYAIQSGKGGGEQAAQSSSDANAPAAVKEDNGRRIDELVAVLAKNYRENKFELDGKTGDEWTTPPLTMVFMDIKAPGEAADRLTALLSQRIGNSGRVNVVEREILAKLLEELKLGSSALADPATSLRIGKVLSAKIIVTGSILSDQKSQMVMLRLIDTETTAVRKVITAESPSGSIDKAFADSLAANIVDFVKTDFPLRGKVVALHGNSCEVNLGQAHGLGKGDRFEVVSEQRKGSGLYAVLGEIEISDVGKDASMASIIGQGKDVVNGVKIREKQGGAK